MSASTRKLSRIRGSWPVWCILGAMGILMSFISPSFRTMDNLSNLLVQSVPLAIASIGQTFAILSGGIDLSVGAAISLTTAMSSAMMGGPWGIPIGLLALLLMAFLVGLANGLGSGTLRVPPLITSLSLMMVLQGIALWYRPAPGGYVPAGFARLLTAAWGPASVPLFVLALAAAGAAYLLHRTKFGQYVYAVGGNRRIAESAGVNTRAVLAFVYVVCSFMAMVAGLMLTGRIRTGDPIIGTPFGLDSVTAVVIGGTSLAGGRGDILGSIAGAYIVGMLSNIMNMLSVNAFYQYVLKGVLLIVAMIVYALAGRKAATRE